MPENERENSPEAAIPSVDRVLRSQAASELIEVHGWPATVDAVREAISIVRTMLSSRGESRPIVAMERLIIDRASRSLDSLSQATPKPVYNLTGTVLHTNLGRAPLPAKAVEAMIQVATCASDLEYDLTTGRRGNRDTHFSELICRLTGAEAATAVNNNAAAVLLTLNTLALHKEVPVSRGELIEIGGSFRIPEIMERSGAKLVEVGTTNRTHLKDFRLAIGDATALLMKVHMSNYAVHGFTSVVAERELSQLCQDNNLPLVVDLGSGSLVDLHPFGLPKEHTVAETIQNGADVVTFSGDKLLGGPQAGLIVGRAELINKINNNPMKRAMRLDKVSIAALAAVLRIYTNPDRLREQLPALRLLTRSPNEIQEMARRVAKILSRTLAGTAHVDTVECKSQIGSGSLPVDLLPSAGIAIRPIVVRRRHSNKALDEIIEAFRQLPVPVLGRVHRGALVLDLRCLEDEDRFTAQLPHISRTFGAEQ